MEKINCVLFEFLQTFVSIAVQWINNVDKIRTNVQNLLHLNKKIQPVASSIRILLHHGIYAHGKMSGNLL